MASPASAATVTCGDFALGVSAGAVATCFSGAGSSDPTTFPAPYDTFLFLDNEAGIGSGLDTFTGIGAAAGTFTIVPSLLSGGSFNTLLLVLQGGVLAGELGAVTGFAGFAFTTPPPSGTTWEALGGSDQLFGASLYGGNATHDAPVVPEPASMLLLGTGLIGVARMARNRRRG